MPHDNAPLPMHVATDATPLPPLATPDHPALPDRLNRILMRS